MENSSCFHLTPRGARVGPDLYFALAPTPPQCRCESLAEVNTQLRLHMEKADVVNKALREDVEKLTVDWSRSRDELMRKESQWRMEQEVGGTKGWKCKRKAYPLSTTLVSTGRGLFTSGLGRRLNVIREVSDHPCHSRWQHCPA